MLVSPPKLAVLAAEVCPNNEEPACVLPNNPVPFVALDPNKLEPNDKKTTTQKKTNKDKENWRQNTFSNVIKTE